MKFESFEVEEMYYDLHRKYGVIHTNYGNTFDYKKFTYDDLVDLEEEFKNLNDFLENENLE